jgi:hypothetical protein
LRTDWLPPFDLIKLPGQMASTMFSQFNGEQKGLLNQLIGSVNPATLTQILSDAGLGSLTGLLSGGKHK